ncbi:MAG: hypothetical protein NT027_01615 [Proteobacteria bacterium]|nr:hypothetical protein [Pseudomonadota bacterium]
MISTLRPAVLWQWWLRQTEKLHCHLVDVVYVRAGKIIHFSQEVLNHLLDFIHVGRIIEKIYGREVIEDD